MDTETGITPGSNDDPVGLLDQQTNDAIHGQANSSGPPARADKVNILLVDDRPDKLLAVESVLADLGQNIIKAHSGKEALRCLLQDDFAVILLDVNMPGLDGFETAALIRQRKKSEHTPIIFLTAVSDTDTHLSRGYSLGAVDYILAPFLPDVLRTKVSVFVELHRKSDQIRFLNEQLEKRVAELTETNAALEAFTYTIAHDLRAPLRAMLGFAAALLEDHSGQLDASGVEFAGRIKTSAERMNHLVQDLLSYSRFSRDHIVVGAVRLEHALSEALKQCELEIREKNPEIQVESPLPEVRAQESVLVQMLVNLIANGLKFVESGVRPRIRVWAEPNADAVRVWVQDNGIGIAREHQERIFRVFERLHGNEQFPGTGIGLAIVRKGAERMGGRVGLLSEPRQGSRFWFELPRSATEKTAPPEPEHRTLNAEH
jgi:signal transduction histidine kinase